MKKLYTAVILFAACLVFTAVWFSPLTELGNPVSYENNVPVGSLDGLCYSDDQTVRVDFFGCENDMHEALRRICARTVKSVEIDGMLIVYAYSPRVICDVQKLSDGREYNVMAACSDGKISIGTPILQGCY